MVIPNVWETTNQSVKWAFDKNYKLYEDVSNKNPHFDLGKSAVTWVIGIRLADMFLPSMIEVKTLVPNDCDFRVVGPHDGGWVRRQDLHKITLLCSPQEATDPRQRQIQQLNYGTFINIMAEMIQKYAPKILQ